jgi:molybdenum cofactor biosynthesis enzyme MoaA
MYSLSTATPRARISDGDVISRIESLLESRGQSVADAIAERDLYFRVSLVGDCNLACPFCHNEGAPLGGSLRIEHSRSVMMAAASVGFRRIQFTGGEPLLHPEVAEFVALARGIVEDVGITTNGTALRKLLPGLIGAGLTRLHISLQVPVLEASGVGGNWGLPAWLEPALVLTSENGVAARLNLPVPHDSLEQAASFMRMLAPFGCDFKVFAVLPEGRSSAVEYPVGELAAIVEEENRRREAEGVKTRAVLRGYSKPNGVRCTGCAGYARCKEQSHSLRMGADGVLRPCLATRDWDMRIDDSRELEGQIKRAALLAIDYRW